MCYPATSSFLSLARASIGGLSLVICFISVTYAAGFEKPQVIPFAMNVTIYDRGEPHYRKFAPSSFHQIRFLELVNQNVLKAQAVSNQVGAAQHPIFEVDLSRYATAASL